MGEIRNRSEGELWWVKASGSGSGWTTGSTPTSGLIGFCRGFSYTSGRTYQVIMDNAGVPSHHKLVSTEPINVTFDLAYGVTADYPLLNSGGAGHSVPGLIHLEYKMTAPEAGANMYYQFHGFAPASENFTVGDTENTVSYGGVALAMIGTTASGWLA